MKANKSIALAGFAFLMLIVLIVAKLQPDDPSEADDFSKIRIGYLPIAAELPLFVAVEQGYLEEEGFNVELVRFTSSNELGNAATAGHIDVMSGTATNVVFDIAAVSGKKHQLFIVNPYSNTAGHITDHMIVRKGSGISDLSELSGKKIASFPGSVNRIFVNLILEKYGVNRESYEYVEMSPSNWQPALESGSIDAVSALEPAATQIMYDGVGETIFPGFYADLMEDVPLSGHWVSSDYFSRVDRRELDALLMAYSRAIDYIRSNEEEARIYLVEYANVRQEILQSINLNPWKSLGEIDLQQLQKFADILYENGALQSKILASDFLKLKEQ